MPAAWRPFSVWTTMWRVPGRSWQMEQGMISMLAGDLFDTPNVLRRLSAFKLIYALTGLRNFRRWREVSTTPATPSAPTA